MSDEENHDTYRDMLVNLSRLIDDEDLHRMKFKCDNIVKKKQNEKITTPLLLFRALEDRGHLGASNTTFLKDLLQTCCDGKVDGLRILGRYENGVNVGLGAAGLAAEITGIGAGPGRENNALQGRTQPQVVYVGVPNNGNVPGLHGRQRYEGPDLSAEITFLCRRLGKDWMFFMRALGMVDDDIEAITSDHRSVRERIHQCLLAWQQDLQQSASRQKLIDACRSPSVQRVDIATRLEERNYN